jgi:hypothetical protein
MSSPAVETTGMHPLATRRELRRQRRERRLWAALAALILLALLTLAALIVDHQHHRSPVSGSPETIRVPVAASAS